MKFYLADAESALSTALAGLRQALADVTPGYEAAVEVARRAVRDAEQADRAATQKLATARSELRALKAARRRIRNEAIEAWLEPALLAAQSAVAAAVDSQGAARIALREAAAHLEQVGKPFTCLQEGEATVRSLVECVQTSPAEPGKP